MNLLLEASSFGHVDRVQELVKFLCTDEVNEADKVRLDRRGYLSGLGIP